jgi:ligand-binding SRPBCC domain-containing protein
MVRGAFRSFTHEHRFEAIDAGTRMIDRFDYSSPLWLLGKLADALFLERYMRLLLERRVAVLKALCEDRPI